MGIPHIEDLTPEELYDAMQGVLRSTSKIDGSFLAFGVDGDDRFYTERKGGQRYYSLDDWPQEGWCIGFRQAHVVLDHYVDYLRLLERIGRYGRATCEVVAGYQPNVVQYAYANGIILHPHKNFDAIPFEASISLNQIKTDGLTAWQERVESKWALQKINVRDWKSFPIKEGQDILEWLDLPSKVKPYSMRTVLAFKFNRRPDGYTKETWKTVQPLLKEERERIREAYAYRMGVLRRKAIQSLKEDIGYQNYHTNTLGEGFVVSTTTGNLFKIVDREWFTPANAFVHWVRYALIGGRRPVRSSFESRTRDWPLDKRLARLEVLRQRYLANYKKLKFTWPDDKRPGSLTYSDEIHERMLMLFYDLRERLKDGRAGIQRKHSANLTDRDSGDIALVGRSLESSRADAEVSA